MGIQPNPILSDWPKINMNAVQLFPRSPTFGDGLVSGILRPHVTGCQMIIKSQPCVIQSVAALFETWTDGRTIASLLFSRSSFPSRQFDGDWAKNQEECSV